MATAPGSGTGDVDEAFRYRIEEAKYSVGFLFWWHYSSLRNRLRRRKRS